MLTYIQVCLKIMIITGLLKLSPWRITLGRYVNLKVSRCIIYVMCTELLPSAAKLIQTSLKKKKLEKKIYIYEVLKSNVHCHDAHSCETIARSWWKCNLVIWIVHLYLWRREGNCITAWMLNWFLKQFFCCLKIEQPVVQCDLYTLFLYYLYH